MKEEVNAAFFRNDALWCARKLIGAELYFRGVGGIILETEAYRVHGDPACHTFFRKSARDFVETQTKGSMYIYLNYGMHWLLNFLTKGAEGEGFVLIRSLFPVEGIESMKLRRKKVETRALCSGPGKLTQALGLTKTLHGKNIDEESEIIIHLPITPWPHHQDGRIGISKAQDLPWRYTAQKHPQYLSKAPVL